MIELSFRARERLRPQKSLVVLAVVAVSVEGVAAFVQLRPPAFSLLTGGIIALVVPVILLSLRSWSRVGADGITICWGLGRGRTYPWREIRWIDVRETKGTYGSTYAVRMFVEGGRRRSLPGLYRSDTYPAPDFEEQFQQVVAWWELSTDQAARIRPSRQVRDLLTPTVLGLVVVPAVILLAVGFVVVLFSPH
ncbi:hypothetical protein ACGF1Z_29140 [Streptomyces sp. NPDC048018]|uniref:hypothetical protein n=1 Tax=Streptomyces sp. NPDC048018 TaxID=3365499 RepID=UPI0037242A8E